MPPSRWRLCGLYARSRSCVKAVCSCLRLCNLPKKQGTCRLSKIDGQSGAQDSEVGSRLPVGRAAIADIAADAVELQFGVGVEIPIQTERDFVGDAASNVEVREVG